MQAETLSFRTRTVALQGGQALRSTVPAGTVIQVLSGAVRVQEPLRWLGETVISHATQLGEGGTYHFVDGGWLEVVAVSDAQVLQIQRVPALRAVASWIAERAGPSAMVTAFANCLRRA